MPLEFRIWLESDESHDQFWQAMEKNFTSSSHPLVYADWLEERGMNDVAELVRLAVMTYSPDQRDNKMSHEQWKVMHERYYELMHQFQTELMNKGYRLGGGVTAPDNGYYSVSTNRIYKGSGQDKKQINFSEIENNPDLVKAIFLLMTEKWKDTFFPPGKRPLTLGFVGRRTKKDREFSQRLDANAVDNKLRTELSSPLHDFESLEDHLTVLARRDRNYGPQLGRLQWALNNLYSVDNTIRNTKDILDQFVNQESRPNGSPFLEWWLQRIQQVAHLVRMHGPRTNMLNFQGLAERLDRWALVVQQALQQLKSS